MAAWRWALVTGASSGIGEAIARRLAAQGTDLVLVARRRERLEALAAELRRDHGIAAEVIVADLTRPEDVHLVEKRLESHEQPIDLLVNDAGGHRMLGNFTDLPREVVEGDVVLNAWAPLRLTHAALGTMVPRRSGTVIQISSATAFGPGPWQATYVASKAFVNSWTESIRHELRGTGVKTVAIAPGFTRTETPPKLGFDDDTVARFMWQDPDKVAASALRAARRARRAVYTSGRLNKVFGRLSYYGPKPIVVRMVANVMRPRSPKRV